MSPAVSSMPSWHGKHLEWAPVVADLSQTEEGGKATKEPKVLGK